MKRNLLLIIASFAIMQMFAQEKFSISNESIDSKCKDLVTQLNIIMIYGQPFAKSQGMNAAEYGQYVGEQYIKQGWAENGNFEALTSACLYNLSCFMPDSKIEIISRSPEMVKIKSNMINGFIKRNEPCFLITGKSYQDFFTAALKTIAKHGGCNFEAKTEGELVYTTITKD